ncbi:MAG: ABC transporter permease [Acidimicrobiales bacterium]
MNRQVRTELLKQRTTRAFVAGVAAVPVVAALATFAILSVAGTQGNPPLGPENLPQSLGAPAWVTTVIALVLGVVGMAGEYRYQTITTTFLAAPRRRDVVVAKLAAYAGAGAAMGMVSLAVSAAIAVPWLTANDVPVEVGAHVLGAVAGVIGSTALFAALGVAVAALVRNQTAAVAGVLVWLLTVEGVFGDIFPGAGFLEWLPAAAGHALVFPGGLPAPLAAAVSTAYVGIFAVAGIRLTVSRDIS